ncbi:hypothetical protein AO368_0845 [Moraxella catarrhalis]|nr:hypothetical protein AO381_0051 [Moraxella catarrhalis]OAV09153.1 hypothetical protein AO378_1426 [Moraxella catarrhalis]OAV13928.1 hypothetical protein AO376_1286 [Moraxella catarrhalis]OAV16759.1 hypothetical protein AO374_1294 [Moraxella catarrhalis]OAV22302.1 hypothetical protein AO371_1890 [Moraxella catarrhalis]
MFYVQKLHQACINHLHLSSFMLKLIVCGNCDKHFYKHFLSKLA